MEEYTIIDALAIGIVILSGILAYIRGISREILSVISWLFSALVAYTLAPLVNPYMKAIPILSEIIDESCELSILLAFVTTFIVTLIIISLFIPLISNFVQRSSLNSIDRGLGFIFGVVRGAVLIIVLLIAHDILTTKTTRFSVVSNSETDKLFSEIKNKLLLKLPETVPSWTALRYEELISSCSLTANLEL